MEEKKLLLQVNDLVKYFNIGKQKLKAVDHISFNIYEGETLGLVGESGCGKTTAGRTLLRLYEPTGGKVFFRDKNIFELNRKEVKKMRRKMQMIFQDPYASLNPRSTIEDIIAEPLDIHGMASGEERKNRVYELLKLVGLDKDHAGRFPHEFSGGQRQRVGIARALAVEPEFIVCDEPISALDVSIQAQVVNLLKELQGKMGLTYLFIAHDLSMVRYISDRVAVMYLGSIVELSNSQELYDNPLHPYTKALLSAIPIPDPMLQRKRQRIILEGDVPSPINPPEGCKFVDRCPIAKDFCREKRPLLEEVRKGHFTACHFWDC
jgi:oligopeptide transport system ATP-binding protein